MQPTGMSIHLPDFDDLLIKARTHSILKAVQANKNILGRRIDYLYERVRSRLIFLNSLQIR